jgi:hypothetical protein
MKKILATIVGLTAGAALVHAQGFIEMVGQSSAIVTNTASFYAQSVQTTGKIYNASSFAGGYDFALLYATSTTAGDSSPLGADWNIITTNGAGATLTSMIANNGSAPGGLLGPGGTSGIAVNLAPGTTYEVMLVGWSSNEGSSWATVSAELAGNSNAGNWTANGYFGEETIGTITPFATAGTGDPSIFPTVYANGTMSLFAVAPSVSPEPTTLALAGLGGLSMLFLRRRKS